MSIKDTLYRLLTVFPALMAIMPALTGCYDDLDYKDPDDIGDGLSTVTGTFDFMPLSSASVDTRATSVAPDGDVLGDIEDMCVLVYNRSQKLIDIYEFPADDLNLHKERRKPADAANGIPAEESTYRGNFSLRLPYGKYHIYAVANLGRSEKGVRVSTTKEELDKRSEQIQTVDGLRALKVTFEPYTAKNNCEMLGYFTNGQAETSPATAESPGVIVDRPSTQIHSWLRRCVSKITVDFDPSGLNENIHIYLRRVTVRDVPTDCMLGFFNMPDSAHELLKIPGNPIAENATAHRIDFGDFMDGCDSSSDDYTKWPSIMKASKKFPENAHSESAKALILYENMQGDGKDKRQYADNDGLVADRDIMKDNKPFGSYIEVEAYYQNLNAGNLNQGKIIYRFMLGQNAIDNYDVLRNCHYKVTLAFRGNANDVDWHIEYSTPDPVVVPTPYYISYLYNHSMVLPLRMTPRDPSKKITKLSAQIFVNRWWPEDAEKNKVYFSNGVCDTDADANQGNGFLSLMPVTDINVVTPAGQDDWSYNYPYYKGQKDGINRSYRDDYPVSGTKPFAYESTQTHKTVRDTVTALTSTTDNSVEWGIPMYTRAKQLVVRTGYSGNNPYTGHIRLAKVRFIAELNNSSTDTMMKEVTIRQVERIVNPKGVYRKWNSREPFHVRLQKMNDEDDKVFSDYISQGPWRAYIVRGDRDFIDIGRPGNKTASGSSGSPIDFNIRFKGSGSPTAVKNCVIRVEYNNYSCYHLIFIRQGYEPIPIVRNGESWYVTNMLGPNMPADHPCDEGSMFKFGYWRQPIDVGATTRLAESWPNLTPESFQSRADQLLLYSSSGTRKAYWKDIIFKKSAYNGFSVDSGKVAQTKDFDLLVKNCDVGFGVLYADGATETATDIATAYGYNRATGNTAGYGMRGAFAYNASTDEYGGRNIFFPIGFTGYGQRKDVKNEGGSGKNAVLRYAAGRYKPMQDNNSDLATRRPILWDLYRKPGAIYWARQAITGSDGKMSWGGLDINYFSFDFNNIDMANMIHMISNTTTIDASNACFIRCIK